MRVLGFKTASKMCGHDVTIDLKKDAYVYEVGKGLFGRTAKDELPAIEVPFRLFSAFSSEQSAPAVALDKTEIAAGDFVNLATKDLRKGSVYRLEVVAPDGRVIPNREKVFAADGRPLRFQFPFSDAAGAWCVRLMDIATGLVGEVAVTVR